MEEGINCNAQMGTGLIQKYCELDRLSLDLLRENSEKYGYSARVIHKLLRLARTSADLDGAGTSGDRCGGCFIVHPA